MDAIRAAGEKDSFYPLMRDCESWKEVTKILDGMNKDVICAHMQTCGASYFSQMTLSQKRVMGKPEMVQRSVDALKDLGPPTSATPAVKDKGATGKGTGSSSSSKQVSLNKGNSNAKAMKETKIAKKGGPLCG